MTTGIHCTYLGSLNVSTVNVWLSFGIELSPSVAMNKNSRELWLDFPALEDETPNKFNDNRHTSVLNQIRNPNIYIRVPMVSDVIAK